MGHPPQILQALPSVFWQGAVAMPAALIVLASIPRPAPKRLRWWRSRWIGTLGIIGGACWCGLVWWGQLFFTFLVHVAIQGIGMAESAWLSTEGSGYVPPARIHAFLWYSLLGVGGVLVSLCSINRLAQPRRQGLRRRWAMVGLFSCGLLAAGAYVIWLGTRGLRGVSAIYAQIWGPEHLHVWISALLLVIVFVTAAAYRMLTVGDARGHDSQLNWRRRPKAYYHEHRGVLLLVAAGLTGLLITWLSRWWNDSWYLLVESVSIYLPMAVLLVVLQKFFTGWSRSAKPPTTVPELPLGRFCTVWIALFLMVVLAVPTIAALAFAVWLSPWYRLPWP